MEREHMRRWLASRCACQRPVIVSDPSRYPHMCAICGGHVQETRDDDTNDALLDAYQRVEQLERENRVLRVMILVFIAIAVIAVWLYDHAVTTHIGGQP